MKTPCIKCKHFVDARVKLGCNHPAARRYSTIYGWHPATITPVLSGDGIVDEKLLEDCAKEHRFEKKNWLERMLS